jgi:8-oxo-dGTP pyrophosphatase MutT (NUDIX family)
VKHVHLAAALAVRDGRVLVVASHYPNHPQPLWNLPGGRQHEGELLPETAVRECLEETGYRARVVELAYVSESYDRSEDVHFVCAVFVVELLGGEASFDNPSTGSGLRLRMTQSDDHVVDVEWVAIDDLAQRIVVPVVRDPLLSYLRGEMPARYAGFADAGITIRWPSDSR